MTLDDVVTMLLAVAVIDAFDGRRAGSYAVMCAAAEGARLSDRALRAGWVYR